MMKSGWKLVKNSVNGPLQIAHQAAADTSLIDLRNRVIQKFPIQAHLADLVLNYRNKSAALGLIFNEMLQETGFACT